MQQKARILGVFSAFVFALLAGCTTTPSTTEKSTLEPVQFSDLPGWTSDHQNEALGAFQKSCKDLSRKSASAPASEKETDWRPACSALADIPPDDAAAARRFFETHFTPFAVASSTGPEGLFTGYYEAALHGSWQKDGEHQTPLYAHPNDLISADLGLFKGKLKGEHIEGKVVGQKLLPYDDRAEIERNSLNGRADVLLWVDDPVDAFFLAVQGSGRVIMTNGDVVHVGYDAPNGRAYVAIGGVMAEHGQIEKPVSMQKIRAWLRDHPTESAKVMNENPSYIFFRIIKDDTANGPLGAEGVSLTEKRSLAVDPSFITLGTPVWLDTTTGDHQPFQRLMVAQDTGGAIKGAVRGDVFWGYGADAEREAGSMQNRGRYFVLLPKKP